jgi:hypothetical protein
LIEREVMMDPTCLTLRKNLDQFVVVGSVPVCELESVNVLADEPIVKPHIARRCN